MIDETRGFNSFLGPMSDETLRQHQRVLRDGIRAAMAGEPWILPARAYVERIGSGDRLQFRKNPDYRAGVSPKFRLSFTGDEQAGIIGAAAQLLLEAGDHLWACPECGRP